MMNMQEAVALREQGRPEEARAMLAELLKQEPGNPDLWYQYAWVHDVMELEREAVPHYKRALELGLAGEARPGAMLGLGSTLRTLGRYAEARALFEYAIREYPERREFETFYAMVLYNLNDHAAAMHILLRQLADTSRDEGIQSYGRAIGFYADQLDRIWA
ncbi:tetratricopeptide repeat protein [Paenibacillus glycinis]|uniref:Tetratricopeptide repeat protein n=1 Tax=Paenibacillus glycinis TaxID=2697035 RepID=A0ABW9XIG6_9BACL|nr:tetratricopeptide repeat protein [Paenibacillus glycinis]NBD22341.1 tetratricopeptide repeat protein [Paenibacillus glycinis]